MNQQRNASLKLALSTLTLAMLTMTAQAQTPAGNPEGPQIDPATQLKIATANFDFHPGAPDLGRIVRTLQSQPAVNAEMKAASSDLVKEATALQTAGRNAEARRVLSHAVALLQGNPWDAKAEFSSSLSLRSDLVIADSAVPVTLQLSQIYPAAYKSVSNGKELQLKVSVAEAPPLLGTNIIPVPGKLIREGNEINLPLRDLNDNPFRFAMDFGTIPDGAYLLVAEAMDGTTSLGKIVARIDLIKGLNAKSAEFNQRLTKIKGHDDTKASIRYPFELARAINAGTGETNGYDYAAGVSRSAELLTALEKGKDLLYQAKGDLRRHYYFADAGEIMPYRLYVPGNWNNKKKLPLIVALHGGGQDENSMLTRGDAVMQKLAEKEGYIVVGPVGYRFNGGYGETPPVPSEFQGTTLGFATPAATPKRILQLSEKDVLNVLDKVATEYNVDLKRVYIMGNSAGGGGTWLLASKYPERFAAAAPCASSMDIRGLAFDKLKSVPLLSCVGSLDADARRNVAKYGVGKLKELGANATYIDVPNATHGTGVEIAMPQIFAFFDQYQK